MAAPAFIPIFRACLFTGALTSLGLAGCSTTVERLDTEEVQDLSGAWNDTDSRLVSQEMIADMLEGHWLSEWRRRRSQKPAVIVGAIRNLSHEHINVITFVSDMERSLINSGRVQFVASSTERDEIREERKDQDIHASEDTRKAMGQEYGADFMLKGAINTIIDAHKKTQIRYYQTDLTLISMADNRKVWVGQKKIKKLVKRSSLRY
jgi:hypothetical protein